MFPYPPFFSGAKLNFAENLLFPASAPNEHSFAVIAATEDSREYVTWKQLRARVAMCAGALRHEANIKPGQRVAGYVANHTNALVAMLATTSIGAIWNAISPDTGVQAVLDRFDQIEPSVMFVDNAVKYNGKTHETYSKVIEIVSSVPSVLLTVIVFDTIHAYPFDLSSIPSGHVRYRTYETFISDSPSSSSIIFEQLPPDHPVYILFSSGTTGPPKCIVHGAAGTLIQHKKEHQIQADIRPGDRLFYYTTCTWMMWHWLISGLATGATLVLYDGSPFYYSYPEDASPESSLEPVSTQLSNAKRNDIAMPLLIASLGITHFGTSAKYLTLLEQKNPILPPLPSLKAIYSTASPLPPSTFRYVYKAFPSKVHLASITGGTDILSLFGAPSPLLPVHAGEIQCRGLGMAVEIWSPEGKDVTASGDEGDLVCVKPFPCQPVFFWKDSSDGAIYRKAYFSKSNSPVTGEPIWHHGDFCRISPSTGGMTMLGRSDGVLKPAGIRFGSAEIYNCLFRRFSEDIEDALCVGRRRKEDVDETVVLFVKMRQGIAVFSEDLRSRIKQVIRTDLSIRHVPGFVDECPDIPVTTNGKKVEVVVKQIISGGTDVKVSASVANKECLDWYRRWAAEH